VGEAFAILEEIFWKVRAPRSAAASDKSSESPAIEPGF
jgi:hypothetical protein